MNRRPDHIPTTLLMTLILALHGCGGGLVLDEGSDDDDGVDSRGSFIVNGQTDSGHPAVGLLKTIVSGGYGLCTATLIGSKTVLTAAHCVDGGGTVTFQVGGQTYQAASVKVHESYSSQVLTANDVAVVKLTQAVSGVAPVPLGQTAPAVGQAVTIVGFGVTGTGYSNSGTKRVTQNSVSKVTTQSFSYAGASGGAGNVCQGDSGGPTFRSEGGQEVLIGVHSTASVPCGYAGNDMRVDHFQAWIATQAAGDLAGTDKQAPAVTIDTPAAGATIDGGFSVKVSAADSGSGLDTIKLYVDGQLRGSAQASPASFTVAGLAEGTHNLRADATDKAGNIGSTLISLIARAAASGTPPGTQPGDPPQGLPAAPPKPGTFGASCSSADDCGSRLCASDADVGASYCTQVCDQVGVCPAGAECIAAGQTSVCAMSAASGAASQAGEALLGSCSVTFGGAAAPLTSHWPLGALLALLLLLRRRRRL